MFATSENTSEILGFVVITMFSCPLEVSCPQFSGPLRPPQRSICAGIGRGITHFKRDVDTLGCT